MITIEDKIESFKKIINEDINESYKKELEKIEIETKTLLQNHKDETLRKIEDLKKEYNNKFLTKKDKINSKTLKEGKDIILNSNNEIYKEFFISLKEKIKEKYSTSLGVSYLNKTLELIKNEVNEDDVIYLCSKFFKRDREIILNFFKNIEIKESENIKLGGFEVVDKDRTYRLNYSVDFILNEKYNEILSRLKKELSL